MTDFFMKTLERININTVLLTLYLMLIWTSYICLNVTTDLRFVFILLVVLALISMLFSSFLMPRLEQAALKNVGTQYSRNIGIKWFCLASMIAFACMLPWYIAYYPGGFSKDSIYQLSQAIGIVTYNDWHPVFHTLVFFKLPLMITGEVSSIILFQIIWFALSIGYMGKVLYKYAGAKTAVISLCYILLNPSSSLILLYPWKDTGFAIAGTVALLISFEIVMTKGEWLNAWWKYLISGFLIVCTILFRHNGVLFSIPLIIYIAINIRNHRRNKTIALLTICIVLLALIKFPLYGAINVRQPDKRVLEAAGLPLTVIGNVAKETPDKMDSELASFVYAIAPQEQWENDYVQGSWNSIKWQIANTEHIEEYGYSGMLRLTVIEKYGYSGMLRLMLKAFFLSPGPALRGAFALTDLVYGIDSYTSLIGVGIYENTLGISYQGNEALKASLGKYTAIITNTVFKYLWTLGSLVLVIIAVTLSKLKWKSPQRWKKIFISMPVLAYDFGTMLLLSGDDWRFFYITYLVLPIIMVGLLIREGAPDA